jgi:hypothetical protein
MNKFNDLMEKVARMVVHMDVVQDKLFKMVDAVYQAVVAGGGVDNAAAAFIPNKIQKLTHPDLIDLRDRLAAAPQSIKCYMSLSRIRRQTYVITSRTTRVPLRKIPHTSSS